MMELEHMTEKELLEEARRKIDAAPLMVRPQVAAILEPVCQILERMIIRIEELEDEIDC